MCPAGKKTVVALHLHPTIRLEKDWGAVVHPGSETPVLYNASGADVPTADGPNDFKCSGGAGISASHLNRSLVTNDIRSGDPGATSLAIVDHPLYGEGHALDAVGR
jgi:hypothetical protein